MDEQARYDRARKRVEELKGFYQHLAMYVLINAFLIIVSILTCPGYHWYIWPLIGWGIGIAIHAATVFGPGRFWGAEWEERKIKELVEKGRERGED